MVEQENKRGQGSDLWSLTSQKMFVSRLWCQYKTEWQSVESNLINDGQNLCIVTWSSDKTTNSDNT